MGRSNNSNNNSLVSSGESGVVSSSSSSSYLSNFPPVSSTAAASNLHHHVAHYPPPLHHHPHHPHYNLPPSPPIHPNQYINMGHLTAAQQFYEAANNNLGGSASSPILSGNNVTPPARVYSPMSHGSNSSNSSGSSSALSYASNGDAIGGSGGNNSTALTIMGAMNAAAVASGAGSVKFEYEDYPREPDGGPVKPDTWKEHVAVFNMDQVGVMCDVLLQEGDMDRLVDLLATIAKDFIGRSEKILRAQAHVAFHAAQSDPRKFPQVYKILETNSFSSQYHPGLQKLWFQAHYKEAEITRGRSLGAVDKYRIRRKFPLPRTIWDGEETVYCFKERSRNALRQSFALEKYPNLEEKKKLSQETGLTMTQVGNWFKNKRQREKEKMQGKAGAKRPKPVYNTPAALAAMTPDLLGIMLNQGAVNQAHLHHHHHHPSAVHHAHPHHQSHIAPLSPEDLENAIRKARYEEAHRFKNYMDENMYPTHQHQPQQPSSSPLSPSNLQTYVQQHHNSNLNPNNGPTNNNTPISPRSSSSAMAIPGKSDITIGIVGSPSTTHPSESSPRSNGGGLTITAIPSPNPNNSSSSPQNEHSGGNPNNGSPSNNTSATGEDMYRPRSTPANLSSVSGGGRCGADMVPAYLHPSSAHHPQHSPYHSHHHHHHLHHSALATGYDSGVGSLIHPGAAAALSHA